MAIEKIYLDPNASTYADLADLDSAAATKLGAIAEGAEVNPTPTAIKDSIVALDDDSREIVISRPGAGQKKIYAIQTHSDGKQEVEQNDTAEE